MANDAPDQTIVQAAPFTVKAHCVLSGGGQDFYQVYATTTENDGVASSTDIFDTKKRDLDFDNTETFVITQDQEAGAPPPPSTFFPITAHLWSRGGTSITLELAQGGHLFSANASEQKECTYAGFAVVHHCAAPPPRGRCRRRSAPPLRARQDRPTTAGYDGEEPLGRRLRPRRLRLPASRPARPGSARPRSNVRLPPLFGRQMHLRSSRVHLPPA